jgi:hypothetical protein
MASKEIENIENIPINELIEEGVGKVIFLKGDRHAHITKKAPTDEQVEFWRKAQRQAGEELYEDFTEYLESLPLTREQDSSFSSDPKKDTTSD